MTREALTEAVERQFWITASLLTNYKVFRCNDPSTRVAPPDAKVKTKAVMMAIDDLSALDFEGAFYRYIDKAGRALAKVCLADGLTAFGPFNSYERTTEDGRNVVGVTVEGW